MTNLLNKTRKPLFQLVFILTICNSAVIGQVSISGPVCVIPGTPYQYVINGQWSDSSYMRICVIGGKLNNGETCTAQGTILSDVIVVWNDTSMHHLEFNSSSGNIKLELQSTKELAGGLINAIDRVRIFDSAVAEYSFQCSPATGGTCAPIYIYQWQKSENGLNWVDITGANEENLLFREAVKVNTYFRRVVEERGSATIAYSDAGLLSIDF